MEFYNNALRIARVKFHNRSSKSSIQLLMVKSFLNTDTSIDFQRISQFHGLFEELSLDEIRRIKKYNKPFIHAKLYSNNSTLMLEVKYTSHETLSELEYARDEVVYETDEDTGVYNQYQLYEMDIINYRKRLQICRGIINGKKK